MWHDSKARVALAATALSTALLITGCAVAAGTSRNVVTVTRTVQSPPGGMESSTSSAAPNPRLPDSSPQRTPADGLPAATLAAVTPATSTTLGPPTTISSNPPALPNADVSTTTPSATHPGGTVRTGESTGDSAGPSTADPGPQASPAEKPPSTPSIGDLFAAAARDAAAAGVAQANPDTAGPDTGPACAANSMYFNEAPNGLRADVIASWKQATQTATAAGITLCLNDGKRSRAQQEAQFDDYAQQYGEQVAAQLVLPPNKSAHVVGIAIDVQPAAGYRWLQNNAGSLGFCRIYDNEPWHFEFNPAYTRTGCPERLPEPPR